MDFKLGASANVSLAQHCNQFCATGLFLTPENIRKPLLPAEAYQNPAKDLRCDFCENNS